MDVDDIAKKSAIYFTAVGAYLALSTVAFLIATLWVGKIGGKLAQAKGGKIDALFFAVRFLADLAFGGWFFVFLAVVLNVANCSYFGYLFGIVFIRSLFIIGEKWNLHFKSLHFVATALAFLVFLMFLLVKRI